MLYENSELYIFLLLPLIIGLITLAIVGLALFAIYYFFFRSLIRSWHHERAKANHSPSNQHEITDIIRKEVRDELIRQGIR